MRELVDAGYRALQEDWAGDVAKLAELDAVYAEMLAYIEGFEGN